MNRGEYQVSKLTFTIDQLYSKHDELLDQYDELEKKKVERMAALARVKCRHIFHPDYQKNSNKVKLILLDKVGNYYYWHHDKFDMSFICIYF